MARLLALLCFRLTLLPVGAPAQDPDLTSLSLEEFLNVEVTSVRRTRQKLSRTAAAVFVITAEDIRRSGATNLPDLLRLAPGVHVSRIAGTSWAVGIRGFSAVYSNKLLVMVDGRTTYHPLMSGVIWSMQLLPLEDIERVEVIRGPGSTIWGSNAVSGVINIITKRASQTQGGFAKASASTLDPVGNQLGYGGRFGKQTYWRGTASYTKLGQLNPTDPAARDRANDVSMGGFRVEGITGRGDEWMVDSGVQYGNTPLVQMGFEPGEGMRELRRVGGSRSGYVMGRILRRDEKGNETTAQMFIDEQRMDGGITGGTNVRTIDFDVHRTRQVRGGHHLMLSTGFRSNTIDTQGTRYFWLDPAAAAYRVYNAVVQDEWQIVPDQLYLTGGTKLEYLSQSGWNLQPSVRALWAPVGRLVAWGAYSHAVRTPSHVDLAVRFPMGIPGVPLPLELTGNAQVQPERLDGAEAGMRLQVGKRVAMDLAVFRHRYRHLLAYAMEPVTLRALDRGVVGAMAVNGRGGHNEGGEAVAYIDISRRWQLTATYSYLCASVEESNGYTNENSTVLAVINPRHHGYVRSSWDFKRRWTADITAYRTGALPGGALPAMNRVDFRIGRSLGEFTELSVTAQNLLRAGKAEFPGSLLVHTEQIRQSIGVTLTHRF